MNGWAGRVTPFAEIGRALTGAGADALMLSEWPPYPHVELLLPHCSGRAAQRAFAQVGWRWRIGGDGAWRLVRRRRYSFDGGFLVTVHHALPTGPVPTRALRRLERALWQGAARDVDGLLRPPDAPLLVFHCLQASRGAVRSTAQRAELLAHARAVSETDAAWTLAREAGVEAALCGVLGESRPPPRPARPRSIAVPAVAWRATRALRAVGQRRALAHALLGEPWQHCVTRCRFDGLELLAGAGTFLPRAVSEQVVHEAAEQLVGVKRPVLVDVGTGCGAIALALARRFEDARVHGFDLDEAALAWARRNGRRLGISHAEFAAGSLLEPVPAAARGRVSLVVGNVPCVPPAAFEGSLDAPAQAYVGADADGLGLQRRLAADARDVLAPGGWLLVQLAPSQWAPYRDALRGFGFDQLHVRGGPVAVVAAGRWTGGV